MRLLFSAALTMLLTFSAAAQNMLNISGTVFDENNEPAVGVSVIVKGTTTGTVTNTDGTYNISAPSDGTLMFSLMGLGDVEEPVSGRERIDAQMGESASSLDEVVVIGYGVARKRDLTGAVSSVRAKELAEIPVTSTAQAITGRMAGVQITTTEGSPDAEVKIRVRGGGSISQDNSPLYIVDGFPVGSISDIPPSDIQSLDVLKDASSTAIYGARGANGVVIITTKSGREGKVTVNFNSYFGIKKIAKTLDVLDPYEYTTWQYELAGPSGNPATNFIKYYGDYSSLENYRGVAGTNWQEELFGRTAATQYYNLGINGGSKAMRYNLSLTRNDDQGIMIGSGYVRNNINFKLNGEVNKVISFDFNTRYSNTVVEGAGVSGGGSNSRLRHAIKYPTTDGLLDISQSGNDVDFSDDIENASTLIKPTLVVNDDYRQSVRNIFAVNGAVKLKIHENLNFRSEVGTDIGNNRSDRVYGPNTSQARQNGGMPEGSIESFNSNRWRVANILTFDKENILPDQNLTLMVGQELNSYLTKTVTSTARSFPSDLAADQVLAMMNLGAAQPISTSESPGDKMSSFFGRLNYSYKDKYLATVTMRADGSSKFAKGNQWGYFPSVALAWRLSDEEFMSGAKSLMNEAKIRLSYGTAGNNRISDNLWRLTYSAGGGDYFSTDNSTPDALLTPSSSLSNPKLKWETTITRNVGLDLSFFESRLNATVDLYYNTTKDLLIAATIPANTGYSTQYQNIGETSNKGIEVTLDGTIYQGGGFVLRGSFNISFNRNRVEKLNIPYIEASSGWSSGSWGPTGDYLIEEGKPVGLMYGYVTDGMYTFDDFTWSNSTNRWELKAGVADNSALIGATRYFGPGTLRFKKLNLNPEDPDSYAVTADMDRTIIGNANPKHTGGFGLTASYKGFDFSAFFNWVYGNSVYNANKLEFTSYPDSKLYGNLITNMQQANRFTIVDHANSGAFVETDPTRLQEINQNASIWHPMMTRVVLHSWAVEDGSFLRLNNVTLGYTLPKQWTLKAHIESLRIYVTGSNLLTFTKYSGYDPEVDTRRGTPMTPNVDYSAYPRSRTFIAGINLTF